MTPRSVVAALAIASLASACAAERRPSEAPAAPAPERAPYAEPPAQGGPPAAAASAAPDRAEVTEGRGATFADAENELAVAERELGSLFSRPRSEAPAERHGLVSSDCRNACRALGSMDRAAGRLCGLARSEGEQRRCEDAKVRVYSARDTVKRSCTSCPDVSVERSAPVPSR